MGDTIENWRAKIGSWSGGSPRNSVTLLNHIAQTSNHIGYKYIRYLVLISLLIIGCVELNPGPNGVTSVPTQSAEQHENSSRPTGTVAQHRRDYEETSATTQGAGALTENGRSPENIVMSGQLNGETSAPPQRDGAGSQNPNKSRKRGKRGKRGKGHQETSAPTQPAGDLTENGRSPGDFVTPGQLNGGTSNTTQSGGTPPEFLRRPGKVGLHGEMYGVKTGAFLFTRALYRTKEFLLASNMDGAGAFDDLVFRYKLENKDDWKTCFMQLKHKKAEGEIKRSQLTKMSGNFSLFKYYTSYCEIKEQASKQPNLKQASKQPNLKQASKQPNLKLCGEFDEFEFVIYTNCKMEIKPPIQVPESEELSILSSKQNSGTYITFDKIKDKDIFDAFKNVAADQNPIAQLNSKVKEKSVIEEEINKKVDEIQRIATKTNPNVFRSLNSLKKPQKECYVTESTGVVARCDFTLAEEFLSKVKIFQNQSNEKSFKRLIVKEVQEACKASPTVANFIYTKFEEGFLEWWEEVKKVVWLNKNSHQWQEVLDDIINEINNMSKHQVQMIKKCKDFSEQEVQKFRDAIEENTVLNIVTDTKDHISQKKKIRQALNIPERKYSLFHVMKPEFLPLFELKNLWPCKWSEVLVVDCDTDDMAKTVLERLQQPANCAKGLDNSDCNEAENLFELLQKHKQKLILISPQINDSDFKNKLRYIYKELEDNCDT